jgi:single-stranded DNA-binding protein
LVLEQDNGRFTNYIPLDFIQDACDTVDEVKKGDELEVSYRLSGRKWQRDAASEEKYFLNAEALGFKVLKGAAEAVGSKAGSSKAGSSKVGSSKVGSSKVGSSKAGSSKAGGTQTEDYIPDDEVPF